MKNLKNVRYATTVVAACAAIGMAHQAQAQTITVDADVQVQNALTLTVVDTMDFGTIVAVSSNANVASIPISTADVLGPAVNAGTAYIAIVDGTNAQAAQVTVEDGANGANVNVTINNVINPLVGAASFTLANFTTSFNGGASTPRTIATPFVIVFDSGFNTGVNTLDVGASLTTNVAGTPYTDAAYDGGFDMVFSY